MPDGGDIVVIERLVVILSATPDIGGKSSSRSLAGFSTS